MLIAQAKYARLRGVSPSCICQLVKRGVITLVDGKIDPEQADQQLAASDNPYRRKLKSNVVNFASTQEIPSLTYAQASAMREHYRALLTELEFEQRTGKLLPIDQVTKEAFEVGRQVREAFIVLPERVSAILVGQDESAIRARLEEEVQLILRNVLPP